MIEFEGPGTTYSPSSFTWTELRTKPPFVHQKVFISKKVYTINTSTPSKGDEDQKILKKKTKKKNGTYPKLRTIYEKDVINDTSTPKRRNEKIMSLT